MAYVIHFLESLFHIVWIHFDTKGYFLNFFIACSLGDMHGLTPWLLLRKESNGLFYSHFHLPCIILAGLHFKVIFLTFNLIAGCCACSSVTWIHALRDIVL